MRAVYFEQARSLFWMGDLETALESYANYLACPLEDWDYEFVRIFKVDFHVHMGDDLAAVTEAEPMIQDTVESDATRWVLAFVLAPLVRLNRLADAKSCFERSYRDCRNNPKFLGLISTHATYLTAVDEHAKAIKVMEDHAPWLLETCNIHQTMTFYAAGWKLFRDLDAAGTLNLRIKLPESIGPSSDDDDYQCGELADWFEVEAKKISALFDQRNGNGFVTQMIQGMVDLCSSD